MFKWLNSYALPPAIRAPLELRSDFKSQSFVSGRDLSADVSWGASRRKRFCNGRFSSTTRLRVTNLGSIGGFTSRPIRQASVPRARLLDPVQQRPLGAGQLQLRTLAIHRLRATYLRWRRGCPSPCPQALQKETARAVAGWSVFTSMCNVTVYNILCIVPIV